MIDPDKARIILANCGIKLGTDFYTLPAHRVDYLLQWARSTRYRQPRNANGSRARYFHEYLQRRASKGEK